MTERAYKTMGSAGAGSIVIGVLMIVIGIAAGVIAVVNGARLLKHREGLTF